MNPSLHPIKLALPALLAACVAPLAASQAGAETRPALVAAARPPAPGGRQVIPFGGAFSGPTTDSFSILVDPPISANHRRLTGQSALFRGPATWVDKHTAHLDLNGQPFRFTDGVGAIYDRDDAISINWSGYTTASSATSRTVSIAFTIRNGRGRHAGASGGGRMTATYNLTRNTVSVVITEGILTRPRR
jgi:hypothetical protein